MTLRQLGTVSFFVVGVAITGCHSTGQSPARPATTDRAGFTGGDPAFVLRTEGLPTTGNWKCDPLLEDINRDGQVDLVAFARLGDGPHVWLRAPGGGWRDASAGLTFERGSCGGGLAAADVNMDGRTDLVVADHCHGISVFLQSAAGLWKAATRDYPPRLEPRQPEQQPGIGVESVAVGDVNGDKLPDLITGSSDASGLAVYYGDGSGGNWAPQKTDLPDTSFVNRVRLADLNGDGRLDLAATCAAGPRAWLGDGQGGWTPAATGLPTPTLQGLYNGLALGDVNEDGRPDLCVANWVDGPEVYLQQADCGWRKTADVFPAMGGGAYGVALGDVDKDGHLDLCVSGRLKYEEVGHVYGVFLLRGDGTGRWAVARETGLPTTGLAFTWGLALADVDGDGVLDLAAGSGGIVATGVASQPVLPPRLLVWETRLPVRAAE
ncbi:MAG: VCBS repeat-containing protein [Planctomycetota bacterium]